MNETYPLYLAGGAPEASFDVSVDINRKNIYIKNEPHILNVFFTGTC